MSFVFIDRQNELVIENLLQTTYIFLMNTLIRSSVVLLLDQKC